MPSSRVSGEGGKLSGETPVRKEGDATWVPLRLAVLDKPVPASESDLSHAPAEAASERPIYAPPDTQLLVRLTRVPARLWVSALGASVSLLAMALFFSLEAVILIHRLTTGEAASPSTNPVIPWIAACARQWGLTLATSDEHFIRIAGLMWGFLR